MSEENKEVIDEEVISNEKVAVEDLEQNNEEIVIEQDDVQQVNEQIEALEDEKNQIQDRLLRLQAEFDNYKKRTNRERIDERKYKSQDLASELLPVLDNFERALQVEVNDANKSVIEGITMVYNQFVEAFKSEGIEEIDTVNKPFDPNIHHAVMQVEDDEYESNTVVEELQKGYMIGERVIRPAMVKVNK